MSSSVRPLPYASQDEASAGLRTSLRNVPMLPAPSNVDDLIARLESEEVPLCSGPLAALISDARAPDLEPLSPELYYEEPDAESFFAPLALAANTNVAAAATPRNRAATLLRRLLGTGLLVGACLFAYSPVLPPIRVQPDALPALEEPAIATTALSVPPELLPPAIVRNEPPAVEAPAPVAAMAEAATTIEANAPTAAAVPETHLPAETEPAAPAEPVAASDLESVAPESEALVADEQITELPADAVDEPVTEMSESAPLPPSRPVDPASVPFAGLWATSAKACTPALQEEGALLADINGERGRAGGTTCAFKSMERQGNAWKIAAVCSNGRTSWKSNVRLSLNRGRLTWTGRKGTTTYVRCQET